MLLLGPPGRQRVRASQCLLALLVFVVFAGLQELEVMLGLIDAAQSHWLTACNLGGSLLFYAVVRSGLNLRHERDPALTFAQIAFALVSIAWSYAITGPARGAVLAIMVLILQFGMFALRPGQARALAWFGFLLIATVMAWKSRTDPERYPPQVECAHFMFAAIVAAAVSALSIRFGQLRRRLQEQKQDLAVALERIREMAAHDELTGLLNRRSMGEAIRRELERQRRQAGVGVPVNVSLVLVDIDHFKRINDGHGHPIGDLALQHFSQLAREELRGSTDVVARWGGEEFLLMLPDSTPEQARACVDRLRRRLQAVPLAVTEPPLAINFSAGVAACLAEEDIEQAIEQADQAMYRAKTDGRGRTELG